MKKPSIFRVSKKHKMSIFKKFEKIDKKVVPSFSLFFRDFPLIDENCVFQKFFL